MLGQHLKIVLGRLSTVQQKADYLIDNMIQFLNGYY